MAQSARQYDPGGVRTSPTPSAPQPLATQTDEEREDVSIKIGKMIFYLTMQRACGSFIGLTYTSPC